MHILDQIVIHKSEEVKKKSSMVPIAQLEKSEYFHRQCNSYVDRIMVSNNSGVIAEFKRKSPSKSAINLSADVERVGRGYSDAGANAISVLTDEHFFGGNNTYLTQLRELLPGMPLLRKEFIIKEYQVIEAKAIGADIILLICEILDSNQVLRLAKLARSLGMQVLLEMHSADQVGKCNEYVSMVGVNNRDLNTFEVDYERSKKLYDILPSDIPKIAESGLSYPGTCHMLYQHGFKGFLIGEQFMKQSDPGSACNDFIRDMMQLRQSTDHNKILVQG